MRQQQQQVKCFFFSWKERCAHTLPCGRSMSSSEMPKKQKKASKSATQTTSTIYISRHLLTNLADPRRKRGSSKKHTHTQRLPDSMKHTHNTKQPPSLKNPSSPTSRIYIYYLCIYIYIHSNFLPWQEEEIMSRSFTVVLVHHRDI